MQELVKDRNWNLNDQVENMEGRDKIVVKKIKKTLMVTCPYSSSKGKKNRENRTRKRGIKNVKKRKKCWKKKGIKKKTKGKRKKKKKKRKKKK